MFSRRGIGLRVAEEGLQREEGVEDIIGAGGRGWELSEGGRAEGEGGGQGLCAESWWSFVCYRHWALIV